MEEDWHTHLSLAEGIYSCVQSLGKIHIQSILLESVKGKRDGGKIVLQRQMPKWETASGMSWRCWLIDHFDLFLQPRMLPSICILEYFSL